MRAILAKCSALGHRRALGKEGPTLRKTIVPAIYYLLVVGTLGLIAIHVVGVTDLLMG